MPSTNRATRHYGLAQILLGVSMFAGLALATLTLAATTTATGPAADGDPQLPPFAKNIDKETYLKMRSEHIGLLRGWEPGKPFTSAPRIKALNQMKQQLGSKQQQFGSKTPIFNGLPWTPIGPAPIPNGQTQTRTDPVSGRVTAIAIHPTNPNRVYVGTAQGGVYRTLDGGTNWTPIFDAAQSLAIGALALAPSNPSMLYVGTGEANGSVDSYAGVGLYRVDNADTTASLVGPINPIRNYVDGSAVAHNVPVFNGRSISKIVVHPTQPGTVFVGTAGGVIGVGADTPFGSIDPLSLRGLWRSTNANGALGSIAFSRIKVSTAGSLVPCSDNPCTGNRSINDIVMDPNDSTGNSLVVWQNGTSAASDGGVWRSTNAMALDPTTVSFTQTFATTATSTSNGRAVFAFYDAGANTVIYAASGEPSSGTICNDVNQAGAVRRSTDGGQTWSAKLAGGGGFCGGQCFYDIGLAVVGGGTTATDRIHLGGNTSSATCRKIHGRSLDGGATTFTSLDAGLHVDAHAIAVAPSDPTQVWHGNDGGIWKSTDSGSTWTSMNNSQLSATQFQSIALHPTDPNFSIGGTQDNGTNMYQPAATWNRVDFGDGGFSAIDQNAADNTNVTMYHTYFNQTNNFIGLARVTKTACANDNGVDSNWVFRGAGSTDATTACEGVALGANNGIGIADSVLFYAPLALGPGTPNTVYFGTDRLYRSTNKGDTMTVVSQSPFPGIVSAIGISPQDDNYRIVGLDSGGLFFTTTGANPLTSLDPVGGGSVIPDKYVARAVFDPSNKNTAYVTLGGYMGGTTTALSHVWKVTNLNTSPVFTGINSGLPDVPVNAFVVDPADSNNLFAGTDIGVYASSNGGASWTPFGTGLPAVAVFDMAIQNPHRMLRIATHGRGMWQSILATVPVVTTNPTNQTVNVGATATFTAAASGNPTPTVQWQVSTNGGATFSDVPGATSTTLSFATTAGQNGNQYRAVFTNSAGTATTTAATLTLKFSVTYNGNGNTGGSVPIDGNTYLAGATVTVLGNTGSLVKTGSTFVGWNTAADGSGTSYAATGSATFTMGSGNVTLYAKWALVSYTAPSATGTGNITVSFTGGGAGCGFTVSQFIPLTGNPASPPAGSAPAGISFPQGLFTFTVSGCTPGSVLNFTITYPQPLPPGTQYWKYGPTSTNATPHWYVLPAVIVGNTVTFSITDGGLGDDDLAANGTIADQGGPGVLLAPIPALSAWALALLALLLVGFGARQVRCRR